MYVSDEVPSGIDGPGSSVISNVNYQMIDLSPPFFYFPSVWFLSTVRLTLFRFFFLETFRSLRRPDHEWTTSDNERTDTDSSESSSGPSGRRAVFLMFRCLSDVDLSSDESWALRPSYTLRGRFYGKS